MQLGPSGAEPSGLWEFPRSARLKGRLPPRDQNVLPGSAVTCLLCVESTGERKIKVQNWNKIRSSHNCFEYALPETGCRRIPPRCAMGGSMDKSQKTELENWLALNVKRKSRATSEISVWTLPGFS